MKKLTLFTLALTLLTLIGCSSANRIVTTDHGIVATVESQDSVLLVLDAYRETYTPTVTRISADEYEIFLIPKMAPLVDSVMVEVCTNGEKKRVETRVIEEATASMVEVRVNQLMDRGWEQVSGIELSQSSSLFGGNKKSYVTTLRREIKE